MQLSMVVALPGGLDDSLNAAISAMNRTVSADNNTVLLVTVVGQGALPDQGILDGGQTASGAQIYLMPVYPESLDQLQSVQRQFELAGPDYVASASANLTAPNGDQVSFTFVQAQG